MSKLHESINGKIRDFIAEQPLYFVASAPTDPDGHVNVSPKGHADTFRVLDENTVAYLDLTGSGAETIAHARDNGRVTLMFCAFEGPPNIVRLYGNARPVVREEPEFEQLAAHFPPQPGMRAVIVVDVTRVADSCGFSVPFMRYKGDRETLRKWARQKGDVALDLYRRTRNEASIDGLPGYPAADRG